MDSYNGELFKNPIPTQLVTNKLFFMRKFTKLLTAAPATPADYDFTGKLTLSVDMTRLKTECEVCGDLAVLIAGLAEAMESNSFIYHVVNGAVEVHKKTDWH